MVSLEEIVLGVHTVGVKKATAELVGMSKQLKQILKNLGMMGKPKSMNLLADGLAQVRHQAYNTREAFRLLAKQIEARQPLTRMQQMGELQRMNTETFHQGFITLKAGAKIAGISVKKLEKELKKMNLEIKTLKGGGKVAFNRLTGAVQPLGKAMEKATENTKRFKMEWLGILFGAMMAARRLQTIMSSSISTFMEVAGANNEANQALAAFGAQWKFLKFAIGGALAEAFAPLLPTFISFVEWITEFVEQHPHLTAWSLASAFTAFSLGSILAQFTLFAASLKLVLGKAGLDGILTKGRAIKKLFGKGLTWSLKITSRITGPILHGAARLTGVISAWIAKAFGLKIAPKLVGQGAGMLARIPIKLLFVYATEVLFQMPSVGGAPKFEELIPELASGELSRTEAEQIFISGAADVELAKKEFEELFNTWQNAEIPAIQEVASAISDMGGIENLKEIVREVADLDLTKLGQMIGKVAELGILIAYSGPVKDKFPLVYALQLASSEWTSMKDVAVGDIQEIFDKLDEIPEEIVTTVKVTYEEQGGGGGFRDFF